MLTMEEVIEEIDFADYRMAILEDERRDLFRALEENEFKAIGLKHYQENLKTSKRFT